LKLTTSTHLLSTASFFCASLPHHRSFIFLTSLHYWRSHPPILFLIGTCWYLLSLLFHCHEWISRLFYE
jgi:hypothetical protein